MENIDWGNVKVLIGGVEVTGINKIQVATKTWFDSASTSYSGMIEVYQNEYEALLGYNNKPKAKNIVSRMKHTKGKLPMVLGRRKGLYSSDFK